MTDLNNSSEQELSSVDSLFENLEPETSSIELLPEDTTNILVSETTSRFSGASWFDIVKDTNILLAGVGGIGSYVSFLLSRMKPKQIVIYDPDRVELGNLSGQFFSKKAIGTYKISAVNETAQSYSDYYRIMSYASYYTSRSEVLPIMICGFDNMEARKIFYTNWVNNYANNPNALFIDGRLAAEEFQVFAIRGGDKEAMNIYQRDWLFSDEEAEETLCSYKQTSYMATMIGSTMVNIFINHMSNIAAGFNCRVVPFYTEYSAETMFLNTKN